MCSPTTKGYWDVWGRRKGVETHSCVPHRLVALRAHQRDHPQPVCDELVGKYGRIRLDFHHVNRYKDATTNTSLALK